MVLGAATVNTEKSGQQLTIDNGYAMICSNIFTSDWDKKLFGSTSRQKLYEYLSFQNLLLLLPGQVDQSSHGLCVLEVGLELLQILLPVTDRGRARHLLQGLDVAGQRQNVQVVVQENAGGVRGQAQDESLIKPVNHILVGLCPESSGK